MKKLWAMGAAMCVAGALVAQLNQSGATSAVRLAGVGSCDNSAQISVSTATTTQAIALAGGKSIYICSLVINGDGQTTAKLVSGTGANCAAGQTSLTPAFRLAQGSTVAAGSGLGFLTKTGPGNALCVTNSAPQAANVFLTYTQF